MGTRGGACGTALAAALILATGCGGGGDDEASLAPETVTVTDTATPEPVTVYVELVDQPELNALFNGDGGQCTTVNVADVFDVAIDNPDLGPAEIQELLPKTEVTLLDADGSIVGTQTLPKRGGGFNPATGCTWSIVFDLEEGSDFYEVEVERDSFTATGRGESGGESSVFLTVEF